MKDNLKQLRKQIRERFFTDKEAVVKEFLQAEESGDRQTKRLYFTALDKLLFDVANKENNADIPDNP